MIEEIEECRFQGEPRTLFKEIVCHGGREIEVAGQFKAEISVGNATAKELGVLHISPKASPICGSCNEVKSDFANQLKAQYPKVFTGVGKLKEFELKLHVDPNVPPVAKS